MFQEETQAYQKAYFWKWLIPLMVTLAWIVDCSLILLFHRLFHPWVDILKDDTKGDMERILQQAQEIIEVEDHMKPNMNVEVTTGENVNEVVDDSEEFCYELTIRVYKQS